MKRSTILGGALGLAAATALVLTGCSTATPTASSTAAAASTKQQTLTLFTDSDVGIQQLWQNSLIPSFEAAHPNIKITFSSADGSTDSAQLAKISASEKQGKTPPMDVIVDAGFISDASAAGLLQPLTAKTVPNIASITSNSLAQALTGELPYRGSAVVLAYNAKKVSTPPTTLTALLAWIKANPGQFTYNDPSTGGSGQGFVQAVLDSHLTTATVKKLSVGYDESLESKWSAGLAQLAALTPSIYQKTYPQGNEGSLDLLASGQVEMVPSWSDIFGTAKAAGSLSADYKTVSITDPDMPGGPSYLAIPKNSANKAAAETLLNWVLEPAQQAQIVTQIKGFPVIASSKLPDSTQSTFAGVDTNAEAPFYSSQSSSDMNSQWSKLVP